MPSSSNRKGGAFLERKSALAIARQGQPRFRDILIVEDTQLDADRLKATLHSIFGYDIVTRHAATLGSSLDRVIERQPDLIFLDDHLKPNDNAAHTIPFLRRCNYTGPIIVVSGLLDRKRGAILVKAGAAVCIHKDSLDSGSITAHDKVAKRLTLIQRRDEYFRSKLICNRAHEMRKAELPAAF